MCACVCVRVQITDLNDAMMPLYAAYTIIQSIRKNPLRVQMQTHTPAPAPAYRSTIIAFDLFAFLSKK